MRPTLTQTLAAAFVVATAVSASAQTARPDAPAAKPTAPAGAAPAPSASLSAEQILDKAVEMSGGRAAYEKHTSLVMKGGFAIPSQGINGTIEVVSKAPNKSLVVSTIPGVLTQTEGFDGETAWSKDTMNGLRTKTGVELATTRRTAVFNADLKWRELWKGVELVGREKVGGRDAYAVKFLPKEGEGNPQTNYYDAETFLLLRSDSIQEGPMGTVPVTSLFSDYRPVGGIQTPHVIEQQLPIMTVKLTVTEVAYDLPIEDARFAKPQ
jgi:hypothetical protein